MGATRVSDVSAQVQSFWSPIFMQEFKEVSLLAGLVNKDYEGEIKKKGDTVKISQINRPTATQKSLSDADADSFESSKLSTSQVELKADQRITVAHEVEDLVQIQSQLGDKDSDIRKSMMEAFEIKLNSYLYSLVSPTTTTSSVADFNASELNIQRKLASQAKWPKNKGWWALLDPSYMSDALNATNLVSQDFGATDVPVIAGQMVRQRLGFNMLEDNSAGIVTLGTDSEDFALLFHPDFMLLGMQTEPSFQVSSLHPNKQHGFLISLDVIFGAKLSISGADKHLVVKNN